MSNIKVLTVGQLQTNCCLVWDDATREGFVTDPGDDAETILTEIRTLNLRITHILLTHAHFDHILAVPALKKVLDVPVCVHESDAGRLSVSDRALCRMLCGITPADAVTADVLLTDGQVLSVAGEPWHVLHTPGHTRGSCCFDNGTLLLTGDTLFACGCGRTDFPGGDQLTLEASLRFLYHLDGDRLCYPGHEDAFRLSEARKNNPVFWSIRK